MVDWLNFLPSSIRWWIASYAGERPSCEECGEPAYWYSSGGYYCIECESKRTTSVGMLREIEPRDYLEDD